MHAFDVPFLNGGLFDLEDDYDVRDKVKIPNAAFAAMLDLFERYNFIVTESTPLDIEVAVDPEMLGKVFEELVTGRHETGSYYTPRPIVAFMCREALKHYLATAVGQAFQPDAISPHTNRQPDGQTQDPGAPPAVRVRLESLTHRPPSHTSRTMAIRPSCPIPKPPTDAEKSGAENKETSGPLNPCFQAGNITSASPS